MGKLTKPSKRAVAKGRKRRTASCISAATAAMTLLTAIIDLIRAWH